MKTPLPAKQISESFRDLHASFNGMELSLETLCANTLVCGSTGCGKTLSVINPLSATIANQSSELDNKAALIYFNLKGDGSRDFCRRLSPERQKDVVMVGSDDALSYLEILSPVHWKKREDLQEALTTLIVEVARQCSNTADLEGGHKQYFEGLRDKALGSLSRLKPLIGRGPIFELRKRTQWFMAQVGGYRKQLEEFSYANKSRMLEGFKTAMSPEIPLSQEDLQEIADLFAEPLPVKARTRSRVETCYRRLMEGINRLLVGKDFPLPVIEPMEGDGPKEMERVKPLVELFAKLSDQNFGSLHHDLDMLFREFESSHACSLFQPGEARCHPITYEDVVDQGKILIVELSLTGSGGAARSALIIAVYAMQQALLRRLEARNRSGEPLNRKRPVVVVLDEFHTILSRGRNDGVETYLSRCRSNGIINLMAVQNLQLVATGLHSTVHAEALLGNFNTIFFGSNPDRWTNQLATEAIPQMICPDVPVAAGFADMPEVAEVLARLALTRPISTGSAPLATLQPGEFLVKTPQKEPCKWRAF